MLLHDKHTEVATRIVLLNVFTCFVKSSSCLMLEARQLSSLKQAKKAEPYGVRKANHEPYLMSCFGILPWTFICTRTPSAPIPMGRSQLNV